MRHVNLGVGVIADTTALVVTSSSVAAQGLGQSASERELSEAKERVCTGRGQEHANPTVQFALLKDLHAGVREQPGDG